MYCPPPCFLPQHPQTLSTYTHSNPLNPLTPTIQKHNTSTKHSTPPSYIHTSPRPPCIYPSCNPLHPPPPSVPSARGRSDRHSCYLRKKREAVPGTAAVLWQWQLISGSCSVAAVLRQLLYSSSLVASVQ